MSDVMVTLVGNVATAVEYRESATGGRARFRFAVPSRRWDRQRDAWTDGPTSFYTVWAWRALGANLAASVGVGEPLVVHGRLRVREEEWEGKLRTSVDVDAMAAGHDLTRGTSAFRRVTRTEAPPAGQPAVAAPGMGPPPPVPSAVPMPPTAPTTPTTSATSTGAASSTVPATGVHGSPTPSAPSPLSHPLEAAGADAFEPVPCRFGDRDGDREPVGHGGRRDSPGVRTRRFGSPFRHGPRRSDRGFGRCPPTVLNCGCGDLSTAERGVRRRR
ncbi:single-stranded DNA-binding protein [Streptomyces chengbuensis]|uniref:single-stranded DNA-binding protein n=1 Tax=Streptomyces chengbuensis TaxID=3053466 RepID=UPI003F4D2EFF